VTIAAILGIVGNLADANFLLKERKGVDPIEWIVERQVYWSKCRNIGRSMKSLPRVGTKCVIDMHVHIGPEFLRRRYSAASLAEEAREEGFGVVMKNHFQPTTGQVSQLRRPDDTVPLIGSVALNFNCGGLDDHGVRAGLSGWKADVTAEDPDADRFVVWMPTMCCEAHLRLYNRHDISLSWGVKSEYTRFYAEGTGYSLDLNDGPRIAAADRALELIKKHDLVLATGHLDKQETLALVQRAYKAGIRRLILTHPLFPATALSPQEMAEMWRAYGAYSELCFSNLAMDHLTYDQYMSVIEAVGSEGVLLSSDVGQIFSPTVKDSLIEFFSELRQRGIKEDDIVQMSVLNPNRLLFEKFSVERASDEAVAAA
jgi:hypothetical protein